MLSRMGLRSFCLVPFSSLREATEVVRKQPSFPSQLVPGTAHFKLFASCFRLMNKEFTLEKPDAASLVYLLDRFRDSGVIPASSYDQQLTDLYMRFRALATRSQSLFSSGDLVTVVWRLQQARIAMDMITMRDVSEKLSKDIAKDEKSLPAEVLVRAIEAYASMMVRPDSLLYESILPVFPSIPKTQDQVIRMLVAMCIFNNFSSSSAWTALLSQLQSAPDLTYLSQQRLRMLHYILSIEYPYLLTLSVNKQPVKSLFSQALSVVPRDNTDLSAVEKPNRRVLCLHDEVQHVFARDTHLFPCKEHFNIGNAFLVDFAQESQQICIDIDAPHHYYRPKLGSTYLELGNSLLNGFTVMKYRTLTKAGWHLLQLPFYEWRSFYDEREKSLYLARKLRTLRPVNLPKIRVIK